MTSAWPRTRFQKFSVQIRVSTCRGYGSWVTLPVATSPSGSSVNTKSRRLHPSMKVESLGLLTRSLWPVCLIFVRLGRKSWDMELYQDSLVDLRISIRNGTTWEALSSSCLTELDRS